MRVIWRVLPVLLFFSGCVQLDAETALSVPDSVHVAQALTQRRSYRIEASTQMVGFSLMINGIELQITDGSEPFTSQISINDWMISGNNDVAITISWPDRVPFSPDTSSASFRLFANNTLLREFKWPVSEIQDTANAYPHTFTETIRADYFPRVLLGRAERVISSAGVLPREDQTEIADLAEQLRTALREKDMEKINELLMTKYTDLAAARSVSPSSVRNEANNTFRELMEKENYAIFFNGRNSFFSVVDDRAVRLGQGRIGFPEPALIITYRENRTTVRWVMELYFAKINGTWVIIR